MHFLFHICDPWLKNFKTLKCTLSSICRFICDLWKLRELSRLFKLVLLGLELWVFYIIFLIYYIAAKLRGNFSSDRRAMYRFFVYAPLPHPPPPTKIAITKTYTSGFKLLKHPLKIFVFDVALKLNDSCHTNRSILTRRLIMNLDIQMIYENCKIQSKHLYN